MSDEDYLLISNSCNEWYCVGCIVMPPLLSSLNEIRSESVLAVTGMLPMVSYVLELVQPGFMLNAQASLKQRVSLLNPVKGHGNAGAVN